MTNYISLIFLALSLFITGLNWSVAIRYWFSKERSSMIPLIGGVLGVIGLIMSHWKYAVALCWLPIVVDIGCGTMVVGLIQQMIKRPR
jgi:hypothetical protein